MDLDDLTDFYMMLIKYALIALCFTFVSMAFLRYLLQA